MQLQLCHSHMFFSYYVSSLLSQWAYNSTGRIPYLSGQESAAVQQADTRKMPPRARSVEHVVPPPMPV